MLINNFYNLYNFSEIKKNFTKKNNFNKGYILFEYDFENNKIYKIDSKEIIKNPNKRINEWNRIYFSENKDYIYRDCLSTFKLFNKFIKNDFYIKNLCNNVYKNKSFQIKILSKHCD